MNFPCYLYISSHVWNIFFFIPKKNKFWFGRNPSVCTHKKTEIGSFFQIFVIFCLQLLWLFYFFKYLNHFLWTFKKNFLFSDKFRAFLFLQLRKILPSWPGIRTNVHERTDIFGNFVYIFWKEFQTRFETKDIYFLDRRPPAGLGRKVVSVFRFASIMYIKLF